MEELDFSEVQLGEHASQRAIGEVITFTPLFGPLGTQKWAANDADGRSLSWDHHKKVFILKSHPQPKPWPSSHWPWQGFSAPSPFWPWLTPASSLINLFPSLVACFNPPSYLNIFMVFKAQIMLRLRNRGYLMMSKLDWPAEWNFTLVDYLASN